MPKTMLETILFYVGRLRGHGVIDRVSVCGASSPELNSRGIQILFLLSGIRWEEKKWSQS